MYIPDNYDQYKLHEQRINEEANEMELNKYYIINGEAYPADSDIHSILVDILEDEMDNDIFDEMLDECYPEVELMGLTYNPSYVLKEVDPIAYRCTRSDYIDSVAADIVYEVESMDIGDEIEEHGITIEYMEDF